VEIDNYDEPSETLTGTIIDKNTGIGLQTETGGNGIRMKLLEYSWSDNPEPYYFYVKQDGSYNNTKIFKGNYNIEPQGAFVPLVRKDNSGKVVSDKSITTDVKGTVKLDFEVEPFLNVEWVGEPVTNSDGTVTVQVKVIRGTSDPSYQQDLANIALFVCPTPYLGNNEYDDRYTQNNSYSGSTGNSLLGQVVTITTKGQMATNRDWYIRVGARIDCTIEGARRYNYSTIKIVKL
jgi:hypothetical protein